MSRRGKNMSDWEQSSRLALDSERAFVQRKFRKSFVLAKKILNNFRDSPEQSSLQHVAREVPERMEKIPVKIGMDVLKELVDDMGTSPLERNETVEVGIDLSREISCVDRAAAVALQSAFCLRRKQNDDQRLSETEKERASCYIPTDTNVVLAKTSPQAQVMRMIFDVYGWRDGRLYMPLELAVVWIRYCHALGYMETAAVAASNLIHVLLCVQSPTWPKPPAPPTPHHPVINLDDKGFHEHLEELVFLLLVEMTPSLEPAVVTSVLHRAFCEDAAVDIRADIFVSTSPWRVFCRKNANSANLSIRFLLDRKPQLSFMAECIEECLELLGNMTGEEGMNIESETTFRTESGKSIFSDDRQRKPIPAKEKDRNADALEYARELIMDPLWNSESRWENRVRVVAAVLVAFATWRRRKNVASFARATVLNLVSPVMEIVEVIARE